MGKSTSRISFGRHPADATVVDPPRPIDFIRESERLYRAIGGSAPMLTLQKPVKSITLVHKLAELTGRSERKE